MNDNDTPSVWSRYRNAKKRALDPSLEPEEEVRLTLEELERSIAETAASSGIPETGMPPRAVIHQSGKRELSRWFYLLLVLLFAALTAGLVWWGSEHYNP